MVVDSTVDRNFRPDSVYRFNPVVSKNTNELKTGAPRRFGLEVSRLRAPLLGSPIVGTDYESWVWRLAVC